MNLRDWTCWYHSELLIPDPGTTFEFLVPYRGTTLRLELLTLLVPVRVGAAHTTGTKSKLGPIGAVGTPSVRTQK